MPAHYYFYKTMAATRALSNMRMHPSPLASRSPQVRTLPRGRPSAVHTCAHCGGGAPLPRRPEDLILCHFGGAFCCTCVAAAAPALAVEICSLDRTQVCNSFTVSWCEAQSLRKAAGAMRSNNEVPLSLFCFRWSLLAAADYIFVSFWPRSCIGLLGNTMGLEAHVATNGTHALLEEASDCRLHTASPPEALRGHDGHLSDPLAIPTPALC